MARAILLVATGATLLAAAPAQAAGASASAQGMATATVIAPLSAVATDDLSFGLVEAGRTGGSATIAPYAALASFTGAAGDGCARRPACTTPHPARFAVSGEAGRNYLVSVPQRLAIASPGGAAVFVDGFAVKTASRGEGAGRLDAAGQDRFEVGGTLHLPGNLAAAEYRTGVPVVVTYF